MVATKQIQNGKITFTKNFTKCQGILITNNYIYDLPTFQIKQVNHKKLGYLRRNSCVTRITSIIICKSSKLKQGFRVTNNGICRCKNLLSSNMTGANNK
jgi:hypothetical protein